MSANKVLWSICAGAVALIWLPNLLTKGMFMDGVINAVVAENLATGIGSFYHLKDYNFPHNDYIGHPPLAFQLQAFFFQWIGTAHYMERVYSLLCLLVQLFLITQIWKLLQTKSELASSALPVLFFISSPLVVWCYSNNLLENTMCIFTTSSVVWMLRYEANKNAWWLSAPFSGLLLMAALLSKGPVGLFVLAAPILLLSNKKNAVLYTCVMIIVVLVTGICLQLANSDFVTMLSNYYSEQLSKAFYQNQENVLLRFSIWGKLLLYTLPMVLLWALSVWLRKEKPAAYPLALPMILLGLCGSFPLIVSHKQSAFYFLPAMPFFAMGFALLSAQTFDEILHRLPLYATKVSMVVCGGVICISLILCIGNKDKIMRDLDLITDAQEVAQICKTPHLNTNWGLSEQWHFRAYLYRYHKKVLCFPDKPCSTNWYLIPAREDSNPSMLHLYSGSQFNLYTTL